MAIEGITFQFSSFSQASTSDFLAARPRISIGAGTSSLIGSGGISSITISGINTGISQQQTGIFSLQNVLTQSQDNQRSSIGRSNLPGLRNKTGTSGIGTGTTSTIGGIASKEDTKPVIGSPLKDRKPTSFQEFRERRQMMRTAQRMVLRDQIEREQAEQRSRRTPFGTMSGRSLALSGGSLKDAFKAPETDEEETANTSSSPAAEGSSDVIQQTIDRLVREKTGIGNESFLNPIEQRDRLGLFTDITAEENPAINDEEVSTSTEGAVAVFRFNRDGISSVGGFEASLIDGARTDIDRQRGRVLRLDGENDFARLDDPNFGITDSFAFSAAVKLDKLPEDGPVSVVSQGEQNVSFAFQITEEGNLQVQARNAAGDLQTFTSDAQVEADKFQEIGVSYDGNSLRFLMDGEQVGDEVSAELDISDAGESFFIGTDFIGGSNENAFFDGKIDNVKVFNQALEDAEVPTVVPPPVVAGFPAGGEAFPLKATTNEIIKIDTTDQLLFFPFDDVSEFSSSYINRVDGSPTLEGGTIRLDGSPDRIRFKDSSEINTGSAVTQRTVFARFAPDSLSGRQVIFEEGGTTRGLNIYLDDDNLYVGAWNREVRYTTFLSTSIAGTEQSFTDVAVVLDNNGAIESDGLRMYVNGQLISQGDAGQINAHADDTAIGATAGRTKYHDGNSGNNTDYFTGELEEFRFFNRVLRNEEIEDLSQQFA